MTGLAGVSSPAAQSAVSRPLRAAIAMGMALLAVGASVAVYLAEQPIPVVHVSGIALSVTYTSPIPGGGEPLFSTLSWAGSSPYPLTAHAGSTGQLTPQLLDNLTTNCSVWSVSTVYPFVIENLTVRNNATYWHPGSLPTTVQGKTLIGTYGVQFWSTLLTLEVQVPGTAGVYTMPLSVVATC